MEHTYLLSEHKLSEQEVKIREDFLDFFLNRNPVVKDELMDNLGLFIYRRALARILYMHEIYKKILETPGVVMEFGCRWGQNLALFTNFRGLYEPYRVGRTILGFDTFTGFLDPDPKDGTESHIQKGAFGSSENYEQDLDYILHYHEQECPISHVKKYKIFKGDATENVRQYLKEHPETIIALAYFDMDLYKPTKECLEAILPHMPKGSVLAFDELNYYGFPGETIALQEVLGIGNYKIQSSIINPECSYIVL